MKHTILDDGRLLLEVEQWDREEEPRDIYELTERLLANSELEWVDPQDTGDLTEAPMLGIRVGYYGYYRPVYSHRWAWMDYQVTDLFTELMEKGRAILEGGLLGDEEDQLDKIVTIIAQYNPNFETPTQGVQMIVDELGMIRDLVNGVPVTAPEGQDWPTFALVKEKWDEVPLFKSSMADSPLSDEQTFANVLTYYGLVDSNNAERVRALYQDLVSALHVRGRAAVERIKALLAEYE